MATAISPTQVDLTWLASTDSGGSGLAGYRIFRGGTQIATTTATSYSNTGLTANTTYAYTVRAFDNATPANVSADSTVANVTTPAVVGVGGLDSRPSNTTCLAGARPTHALINSALTAGFTTAFELGVPIALAGFLLALLVIRVQRQTKAPAALSEAA